jgi:multidrug resistance protein MdtO
MLVFAGTWVAAWVAAGSPRISYAGQIASAFYLCVIQEPTCYDLEIARDRTIGIVIGNLVTFLVFTRIWPVSISGRIEAALHDMVRQWRQLIATPRREAQRQNAAALALRRDHAGPDPGQI